LVGWGGVNIQTVQPSEMFHNIKIFPKKLSNFQNPNSLKLPNSRSSENPTKFPDKNILRRSFISTLKDLALICRKRSWNVV